MADLHSSATSARETDVERQPDDIFSAQTSEQARTIRAEIKRVARSPFNILITGETGTGKTDAARKIHRFSARANKPFLELNCANLPEQLVEAELFGYSKGAFTGAVSNHIGLFEEANGGIPFLDEIGDILPTVQNKLLKAIEEKQIKRLGTNRYLRCDVQIIAATSRNLPEMIECGEFREDLYCRLAVLRIETAPLRERREDIPAMIDLYLREAANAVAGKAGEFDSYQIDEEAVGLLCQWEYPGNIRTLRNLIYELTSYVSVNEPISSALVQFVLAKLNSLGRKAVTHPPAKRRVVSYHAGDAPTTTDNMDLSAQRAFLRSIAADGDIILPLELCVLRRGETFKEWTKRAKGCSLEAVRRATGGSLQEAAQRLGLTRSSLQAHLHRAKRAHSETLFDWQYDANGDSSDR
jgi:transcriptional regulator with GAF, ATPase, and Fis domain